MAQPSRPLNLLKPQAKTVVRRLAYLLQLYGTMGEAADVQIQRRKFERYSVAKLQGLKGSIIGVNTLSYLVSVSEGGCGFYSAKRLPITAEGQKIVCYFEWANFLEPLSIEGTVLYCVPKDLEDITLFFTGVKFSEEQQFLAAPLLAQLKQMHDSGLIETFLR